MIEKVTDLMEYSRYGALSQMFVVDALIKHATLVLSSTEDDWPDDYLISYVAWRGIAQEVIDKLT